ncbi:MAG: hypothetical protein K6F08_00295 [bacterium]|nr:hypothetical protein [bacterium]
MVKKIIIGFSVLIAISLTLSFKTLASPDNSQTIGVYAKGQGLEKYFSGAINHGFSYEIFNVTPEIFYSYDKNGEILGEFFKTTLTNFNLKAFEKEYGLTIVEIKFIDSIYNIYAKSALLPYKISGKNFNVQIAINGEEVTVASPIIMGSF